MSIKNIKQTKPPIAVQLPYRIVEFLHRFYIDENLTVFQNILSLLRYQRAYLRIQ